MEFGRVIVFLVLVLGVYVAEAHFLIEWWRHRKDDDGVSRLWRPGAVVVHILAVVGAGCMLYGYFVEPYWLEVSRVKVRTDKLLDTRFRIVHLSDLHCDPTPRNEGKLAELINPLNPDIIVFTGDAVNDRKAVSRFQRVMRSLEARYGKFAVRGNWDIERASQWGAFENTGFRLLTADAVKVEKNGEQMAICGLGPFRRPLTPSMADQQGDNYTVYLHHYPSLIDELRGAKPDLYLCGHIHGGQIALPGYGAILTLSKTGKKYEAGRYEVGPTTMYVSRGIGMEGGAVPRVRFWARPEVVVIDVVPEGN